VRPPMGKAGGLSLELSEAGRGPEFHGWALWGWPVPGHAPNGWAGGDRVVAVSRQPPMLCMRHRKTLRHLSTLAVRLGLVD